MCEEKTVFKTALKPLIFCQKFKLGHDIGVYSFPTVYRKPHLGNVGGSSTEFTGKFNVLLAGQVRLWSEYYSDPMIRIVFMCVYIYISKGVFGFARQVPQSYALCIYSCKHPQYSYIYLATSRWFLTSGPSHRSSTTRPTVGPSNLCIGILNIADHPFHSYIFGPHAGVAVF